jgi:hypothetical protein
MGKSSMAMLMAFTTWLGDASIGSDEWMTGELGFRHCEN